jgi:5-methylcytosine-specific restriction endonuclease McrA
VLQHDENICRIQGPRCRGIATTVRHILPSSQHPGLFWDPDNLQAACGPCNYADGAYVKAENRHASRQRIADLEQRNAYLKRRIDELAQADARVAVAGGDLDAAKG